MRYRRLDPSGDMIFGFGQADLFNNQPEAVAQAVLTRMKLFSGEWFLDITDGMDWYGKVLGNRTSGLRDAVIKKRILDTPGINSILSYSSSFDGATRKFNVAVIIDTIYGTFPPQLPGTGGTTTTTASGGRSTNFITGFVVAGANTATGQVGLIGAGTVPPANSGLTIGTAFAPAQAPAGGGVGVALHFTLDDPASDILDSTSTLG